MGCGVPAWMRSWDTDLPHPGTGSRFIVLERNHASRLDITARAQRQTLKSGQRNSAETEAILFLLLERVNSIRRIFFQQLREFEDEVWVFFATTAVGR